MNLFGKPFTVPFNNYGDFLVLVHQVIIDDQYHVRDLVKNNAVVIDGGANMGIFAVFVAHEKPNTAVYAFEPAAETFQALQKNVGHYSQVKAFPVGLGEMKATRDFQVFEKSTVSNHFLSEGFDTTGTETTSATITSIDDFSIENAIPRIDFIKLDTEGYEANILKGGAESIKKWKPAIVMSAYHKPNDKKELPEILQSICPNYRCELRTDNEEDLVCLAD
jgi:FkbM family methyltransferase